jgi:hypothetical protein
MKLPANFELCRRTEGNPAIRLAILDGPVDLADRDFDGASLTQRSIANGVAVGGPSQHGTRVARLIVGQLSGIAPRCTAISFPIFESSDGGELRPGSQLDLVQALTAAIQEEVHVINVSGGQFSPSGAAHPLLAELVRQCERRGILIVAAAGNEGCDCLHVPAALGVVLAVGAADESGEPLPFSNWGKAYRRQGIVAPGEGGTSLAAARVTGVAALLLSLQLQRGLKPNPLAVREALRRSALDCDWKPAVDCRRLLLGRLNIPGAMDVLLHGKPTMPAVAEPVVETAASPVVDCAQVTPSAFAAAETSVTTSVVMPTGVTPSTCTCAGGSGALVYALGQVGYDLVNEARLDSLAQKMAGAADVTSPQRLLAFDPRRLLDYLAANPWDSAAVTWTLNLDGTPVYAIRPSGPYAADAFKQLAQFLREQLDEGVERVSIPGTMAGQTRLFMGQSVPVLTPDLRGMYSWTTKALVESAVGPAPAPDASSAEREAHQRKSQGVRNFLDRVYHGLRNLGQLPQDRAINFAATNAFEIEKVYESAIKEEMDLDSINVTPSPICRPGSDCWDVELYFFFPGRQVQTVRKVYRFTVDVSDVVPVTVGTMRSWFTR